jgi:hypothetical protein
MYNIWLSGFYWRLNPLSQLLQLVVLDETDPSPSITAMTSSSIEHSWDLLIRLLVWVVLVVRKALFVAGKDNKDRRLPREENRRESFELAIVAANCIRA